MRWGKAAWAVVLLLALIQCGRPSDDPEWRARAIGSRIRCPVCRGVPIADSPSALAQEMMGIVRQQIAEGKSDEEVLRYFEERYGEWALLAPKAEGMNLSIWILPLLFLIGGAAVILRRARATGPDDRGQK